MERSEKDRFRPVVPQRLLAGPPWVRLRTKLDLEGRGGDDPEVRADLEALLADERVRVLLDDVALWPGKVLNSHRSASQTFHVLEFLSELGVPSEHPAIVIATGRILESAGEDGIPRLPMTYPEHFGGPGRRMACWALCDAPTLLSCLVRFGRASDPAVGRGVAALTSLVRPNGWPCAVCAELGGFRGPGRKDDPCPYADLIMLRLLADWADRADRADAAGPGAESADAASAAQAGVECLLSCWENSADRHPYLFYMGTDFRKLKAPFLWYDILHVVDVLSRYPRARRDPRFLEMLEVVESKAKPDGSFVPESVYSPYSAWDFGQKKGASPWIEFLVARIRKRLSPGDAAALD